MSLHAFHLVFVASAFLLGVLIGVWGFREFFAGQGASPLVLAAVALAFSVGIAVYGVRSFQKFKERAR